MKKERFQFHTNINFIKQSRYTFVLSLILIIVSCVSLFMNGLNYGIDFSGGVLFEVQSSETIDMAGMRSKIEGLKLGDTDLQSIGTTGNEMLIHVLADTADEEAQKQVVDKVKETLGEKITYRRIEIVGPKVGSELLRKSLWASVLALAAIAIYIWFRFEWQFSLACLVALTHDLILTVGLFSLLGLDFNMTVVAGLLSMAGYVTNDKVVNFDRIRENLKLFRKMPIPELLNKSLNEMLSRTILTSVTTLIMLVVLILMGGETLFGFSVCLSFGVIVGTYSSLYIAVPLLRFFDLRKIGATVSFQNPEYAEASKYEMEAKKAPLVHQTCNRCR